jgi:plasmid stabilization system protein ParE
VTPPRFELTTPAEHDLEEIFFEVKERHGLLVAERIYDNLLRTFELLADMPDGASPSRAMAAPVSLLADRPCLHRLSE